MGQTITIDPITRLEGHGKITIVLDDSGDVDRAFFQVPELRGFEAFCVGRPAEDMPQITSRICGVCPTAHHMAGGKDSGLLRVAPLARLNASEGMATLFNSAAICMSIEKAAKKLIRSGKVSDGILNKIEMAFRAYDPCFSCATHSLPGKLPLEVVMRSKSGDVLGRILRDKSGRQYVV